MIIDHTDEFPDNKQLWWMQKKFKKSYILSNYTADVQETKNIFIKLHKKER